MVYVTHDQVEAMTLGQRIAVFDKGRLVQVGPPLALFDQPRNRFVAGFLGSPRMNLLAVEATGAPDADGRTPVRCGASTLPLRLPPARVCTLGVRPEHLRVAEGGPGLRVTVDMVEHLGDSDVVYATLDGAAEGNALALRVPPRTVNVTTGTTLTLRPDESRLHFFDSEGRALPTAPPPTDPGAHT
jgi:multiple sugar transport system ATP-binding protein